MNNIADALHDAFYEGYEAGKKDAEYYMNHCGDETPTTNADKIRAMNDDELAEFCMRYMDCTNKCFAKSERCSMSDIKCQKAWLDWLKQECE